MVADEDRKGPHIFAHLEIHGDPAEKGQSDQLSCELELELLLAHEFFEQIPEGRAPGGDHPPGVLGEGAHPEQETHGGRLLPAHVGEDVGEAGHEDREKQDRHQKRDDQNGRGINGAGDDEVLEFLALAHELVELAHHLGQAPRFLAAFDQIGVVGRKKGPVGTDDLGKLLAFVESLTHGIDEIPLFLFGRAFGDNAQRPFEGDVGVQQGGQLTGEFIGVDLAALQGETAPFLGGLAQKADGDDPPHLEFFPGLLLVVRLDQHLVELLAAGGACVLVKSHDFRPRRWIFPVLPRWLSRL